MENKPILLNNHLGRESRPRGLQRWIPGLGILRAYKADWLFKDFLAGLALTAILVPVGMGYAVAAGLPCAGYFVHPP